MSAPRPFRVLPAITQENEHFWLGGAQGELRFLRCQDCGWWLHPPAPICPICLSRNLAVDVASGLAEVYAYTVNWQQWLPNFDPPYVVAIVELPEQKGLRLTTNIVGCGHSDVATGMAVRVTFEEYDDVWIPLFEPVEPGATTQRSMTQEVER